MIFSWLACAAPEPYPTVPSPWGQTVPGEARCSAEPAPTASWAGPAFYGFPTATGGDADGDGIDDVVAGDRSEDFQSGTVTLRSGASPGSVAWSTELRATALALPGDLTGDGLGDLLAAGSTMDEDEVYHARLALFAGAPGGPALAQEWTGEGSSALGFAFAAADLDGDGDLDLAIGGGAWGSPEVRIFLGGPGGLPAAADAVVTGTVGDFGRAVFSAGDTDGDGADDLLVTGQGAVEWLSRGGLDPLRVRLDGVADVASVGVGDLDGDGLDDLAVGVPTDDGRIAWWLGAPGGPAPAPSGEVSGAGGEQRSTVAIAPDSDGDGRDELVTGARAATVDGAEYAGRIDWWAGWPDAGAPLATWTATGARCFLGDALLTGGDLDGDGLPELLAPVVSGEEDRGVVLWLPAPR